MPDWIVAIILGLIEGITEFIPVSSTGHLLIAEHWLPRQSDLFNVVIQCGAVIAVLPLFPQRLYKFVFELGDKETQDYLLKIFAAFARLVLAIACSDGRGQLQRLLPLARLASGGITVVRPSAERLLAVEVECSSTTPSVAAMQVCRNALIRLWNCCAASSAERATSASSACRRAS